ncbi:MAG: hypothetical protein ACT4O7_19855 [Aquabacterium sp.]
MKFNSCSTILLAICITPATLSSARADLGHNHADHDRAFLAWAASLKASDAASAPSAKSTDEWIEGTVISVDRQKKLIKIQRSVTSKIATEKNEFSVNDPNQLKLISTGSQVRFRTRLIEQEAIISEIETLEK